MPSPRAVLLTPSRSSVLTQLPSCQQTAPINPLDATLADSLACAANKRLTPNLSPVDATLPTNPGVGSRTSQSSNLPTFQPSNDPRPNSFLLTSLAAPHPLTPIESHPYKNHRGATSSPACSEPLGEGGTPLFHSHQNISRPFFSSTYKLPIFYPLCFDIHPCNGGYGPLPTFQPSTFQPSNVAPMRTRPAPVNAVC
jgi:hypothetical protein